MKIKYINWSELEFQDDINNLSFGLELLDDEFFSFNCLWFETYQEREQFLLDNYCENLLIN